MASTTATAPRRSLRKRAAVLPPPGPAPVVRRARKVVTVTAASQAAPATFAQASTGTLIPSATVVQAPDQAVGEPVVHLPVPFNIIEAKAHLCAADPRFSRLFDSLPCKPFEGPDSQVPLNAFRSLAVSILGQQVSWKAAKSITYRFIRLFHPELPEVAAPSPATPVPFPLPSQVAASSIPQLRTAGLSGRKAEYLMDLATRFSDGRLSASTLSQMNDDEVRKALVAVRGIGPWTAEMFLIFSLRHPDVLPTGDLGIQKGLLRWLTTATPRVDPSKLPRPRASPAPEDRNSLADHYLNGSSPVITQAECSVAQQDMVPAAMPVAVGTDGKVPDPPKGSGLSLAQLRGRLRKPLKRGLYLTPKEMEALTENWKPYRSIGVWYLWSLADGPDSQM